MTDADENPKTPSEAAWSPPVQASGAHSIMDKRARLSIRVHIMVLISICTVTWPAGGCSGCEQQGVALEGDVPAGPDVDGFLDQPNNEDATDVEDTEGEPWLPCRGEPWSECWGDYTAEGCSAEKPFCCKTGFTDIGIACCCEDPECSGELFVQRCYEASLSSIVMDCGGDSSNCPAIKPYCCQFQEVWGGQYVCADHALLNWTCDGPLEP
jgi:hypothetical protein